MIRIIATMATPTVITTDVTTEGESSPVDRPEPEEFLKPGLGTTVLSVGTTEIRNHQRKK